MESYEGWLDVWHYFCSGKTCFFRQVSYGNRSLFSESLVMFQLSLCYSVELHFLSLILQGPKGGSGEKGERVSICLLYSMFMS